MGNYCLVNFFFLPKPALADSTSGPVTSSAQNLIMYTTEAIIGKIQN